MHSDVHLSREPNTCIFEVILAYFPHSCTQTCISAMHLVIKNAIAFLRTPTSGPRHLSRKITHVKKEGCNQNMMLKSVTSATLTIFTLCVCKVHKTEIQNAICGLLYLPYSYGGNWYCSARHRFQHHVLIAPFFFYVCYFA